MSNKDELVKEIVELLKIWALFNGRTCWPGAKHALEERINQLCDEAGLDEPEVMNQ